MTARLDVSDGCRVCLACGVRKHLVMFNTNRRVSYGTKSKCKECCAALRPPKKSTQKVFVVDGRKPCSRCKEAKALDLFAIESGAITGRRPECLACAETQRRQRGIRPQNRYTADGMRFCSKCNCAKPISFFAPTAAGRHQSRCADCRREDWKEYAARPETKALHLAKRLKRQELERGNREAQAKSNARNAVHYEIKMGRMSPNPCRAHGTGCSGAVHGHHWSYEREHWLDVIWLCVRHHAQVHARGLESLNV